MGAGAELRALTGLRFVAALGVLLLHYGGQLVAWAPPAVDAVRLGGHVWVGLFYLLSGFVLARAHPRPMDAAGRRVFWGGRLARLYPLYLLAFLASAPSALAQVPDRGEGAVFAAGVLSLVLAQAWAPTLALVWNGPAWSTSVVFAFGLAFPFLAAWMRGLRTRSLAAAGVLAWGASVALPLAWLALRDGAAPFEAGDPSPWGNLLERHPLVRGLEFAAGVALGLLHARGAVRAPPAAAPLALGAVALVLATGAAPYLLLHNGLLAPLFALVLLALATGEGWLARALASRPAVALGEASFALYILQEPLWCLARALPGAPALPKPGFVTLYVVGAWVVALAAHRIIARPARRLLAEPSALEGARIRA
ncbi:MAG: acyltransferase [Anaeromyxobacter sp.]